MKRFKVFSQPIRSLDFKVLVIVGLVILAMAAGSLHHFKRLADQAQSLLFDAMDAMSFAVHHGLTTQIYERNFDVHAFAENPAVQAMDPLAIQNVLNHFVRIYEMYELIIVTDAQGRFVSSNNRGPHGEILHPEALRALDFSQEPWFKAAVRGETFMDEPAPDPYLQTMEGAFVRTNAFAKGVWDPQGTLRGVICTRVGVRWIRKELDKGYSMLHAGGFSIARIELINSNGERLVEAGTPLQLNTGNEKPLRYPGTLERSRAAKIWSLVEDEAGEFIVASSFLANPSFAPRLGWSVRLSVGSSSASLELAESVRMSYVWILLESVGLLILALAYTRRLVFSRDLQRQVSIRTAELNASTAHLEAQNRELERSQTELMTTNSQLMEAQKELLDTAKRLGQSEVAALTLHNIGNIVTSLNVQSTLLRERLDVDAPGQLSIAYLKKMEDDERTPEQRRAIVARLEAAEQVTLDAMKGILRGLADNVRMAMAAIASQLAFVHQREAAAPYKLSELLHHTLILYFGIFKHHRVKQDMSVRHDASFMTERFLFESVLTVLIRNAIDATAQQVDRQIRFATEWDDKALTLVVQDNGHGFDAETGARIFRFGFSTKSSGHGFGLHYAANSCKHLELDLSLESPGAGQGATARIRIPRERLLSVMELVDFSQSGKEK